MITYSQFPKIPAVATDPDGDTLRYSIVTSKYSDFWRINGNGLITLRQGAKPKTLNYENDPHIMHVSEYCNTNIICLTKMPSQSNHLNYCRYSQL